MQPSQAYTALINQYAADLPQKVANIATCWESAQQTPWNAIAYEKLHRMAHSLKGSSGTFGYQAIYEAALSLEKYVETFTQQPPSTDECEHIKLLITQLTHAPLTSTGVC